MTWIVKVEHQLRYFPVPCVPDFIAGITLFDDTAVTLIDLRHLLEVRGRVLEASCHILVEVEDLRFSLLSDTVPGFITLNGPIKRLADTGPSILLGVSHYHGRPCYVIDAEQLSWLLTGQIDRIMKRLAKRRPERALIEDIKPIFSLSSTFDLLSEGPLRAEPVLVRRATRKALEADGPPENPSEHAAEIEAVSALVIRALARPRPLNDLLEKLRPRLGPLRCEALLLNLVESGLGRRRNET